MSGLLLVSFIAGVLTVLAPCILPLLPVIVGGSVSGKVSAFRVLVIVSSLGLSIFAFTLLLKASTAFIAIPQGAWQLLSGGLLLFFGLVTLVPSLWDRIPGVGAMYQKSNKMLGSGYTRKSVLGDALMGAALGPVFSSCSPTYFVILAAVLPVNIAVGIVYLLAYCAGLCLFLFIIAYAGQRAMLWLGITTDPNGWFKKVIGVLFIVIGLAIIFGLDKKLQTILPAGAFAEINIERYLLSPMKETSSTEMSTEGFLTPAEKILAFQKAPELVSPDGYINTGGMPVTLMQYVGDKVVLIDFWDYSCINCQRTFPYVNAWYEKYKDQGLVIIGVHTPEFAFEQLLSNVAAATERFGIKYPVVLDNQFQTWSAFKNQFWPREYLVDIDGYVVHDHAGEGGYAETEKAIQHALAERAARLGGAAVSTSTVDMPEADHSGVRSPETYFGASRNEYLGNGTPGAQGIQKFSLPSSPTPNTLYLGGTWNVSSEYAEASVGASVLYYYSSSDVYFVATNKGGPVVVQILRDGKPVGTFAGADVDPTTGEATIDGDRLYTLVHDKTPGAHTIEIRIIKGTLDAYTFTFG